MNASINKYTTISSLYEYTKQLELSYDKLFFKSAIKSGNNIVIANTTSLVNKYFDYLNNAIYTVTLSDSEYMKYRYQPKLFCYEIYGTTELWAALLKINNYISVTDFNSRTIKVFNEKIFSILNEILVYEDNDLLKNKESVGI